MSGSAPRPYLTRTHRRCHWWKISGVVLAAVDVLEVLLDFVKSRRVVVGTRREYTQQITGTSQ